MRDFRDAKAMAQTLRDSLTHKAINISHSESLELVSWMLGLADWNTLSALLQSERRDSPKSAARFQTTTAIYPAIPLRDLVPFPMATYPLFVGREKTIQALNHAFERQREVVVAIQRDSGVDEPGFEDIYEVGLLSQLIEFERLPDGTVKVLTQGLRRVAIRRFTKDADGFEAEVADISEGPIPDVPHLIQRVVRRFEDYAAARDIRIPDTFPVLDQTRDPGRVADIIAARIRMPIEDRYGLLATLDPVTRLERLEALVDLSARPLSPVFEATRRQALHYADQRSHQYATLEHFLLALIDDTHASAVMRACDADLDKLKAALVDYLDNELKDIVVATGRDAQPTAAFQRVARRAALHAQEAGYPIVTAPMRCSPYWRRPEVQRPASSTSKACPMRTRPRPLHKRSARKPIRARQLDETPASGLAGPPHAASDSVLPTCIDSACACCWII
ncbi:MAG TPA: LON peptidase substrate-binding domain-containing protein [Bradyrhizobium sp.]|nr:LON peptidase substrate-binding domain-containing protein [Bradyrhizobium sp.]